MSDRNIAGALFDFLGFLTTQEKSVSLGVSELATPAVDLLTEWAKTRGLGLDDADVSGWHSALQAMQGEAEPVAWMVTTERYGKPHTYPVTGDYDNVVNQCDYGNPVPLYTAPQPVVPEAKVWNQAEGRDGKLYTDGWNDCRDAMLSAAKGEAPQPAVPDRYAGVKIWVGEKQVTQMVSKALIENEVAEGISIAEAARRCLNLLSAGKGEAPQPAVPDGYQIQKQGNVIVIDHTDEQKGGVAIFKSEKTVRMQFLYQYFDAMLSAAKGEAVPTKTQISEAIFGWGLRNDDGNHLSMDDTDEIAEYIMAQALLSAAKGVTDEI